VTYSLSPIENKQHTKHTMSKQSGNKAWTMDPTSMLTSMAGMGNRDHDGQATAGPQYRAAQHSQRGSQATMTNGFLSSIMADHTLSHVPYCFTIAHECSI
jgi:hypothetical protein